MKKPRIVPFFDARGRLPQNLFERQRGPRQVGATLVGRLLRVGAVLDAGDVEARKDLELAQDALELRRQLARLGRADLQARQGRDAPHGLDPGLVHARGF